MEATKMITYTTGLKLKTEKIITKNDIITLCNLLNNRDEYSNVCEFEPEPITEGGILYKFKNSDNKFYKSVRFHYFNHDVEWYTVDGRTVMSEWCGNNDIIINKNIKFILFLKSFHRAPLFTIDELKKSQSIKYSTSS